MNAAVCAHNTYIAGFGWLSTGEHAKLYVRATFLNLGPCGKSDLLFYRRTGWGEGRGRGTVATGQKKLRTTVLRVT